MCWWEYCPRVDFSYIRLSCWSTSIFLSFHASLTVSPTPQSPSFVAASGRFAVMMAMDEAKSILAGTVGKNIGPGTGWEQNPQLVFTDGSDTMKLKQNTRTDMWPLGTGTRSSQWILDLWDMDQKNGDCWGIVLFRLPPVCATWRSRRRSGLRLGQAVELPRHAESKPVTAEPAQTYVLRIPEIQLRGGGITIDARPIQGDRNSEMCT